MVKDHYDSEKGNPLPPHRLLLSINSKGSFICTIHPTDRITHTTAFVTPVVEHWLEREIAQRAYNLETMCVPTVAGQGQQYICVCGRSSLINDTSF